MKYPDDFINKVICGRCEKIMRHIPNNIIDLMVTDPPYGYSFMGKDWDRVTPPVKTWQECLRILKPGAFAFIMSGPRQDVLSQMIVKLWQAGFEIGFTSIYWAYASGFPKAINIGKTVDKKLGNKREFIKLNKGGGMSNSVGTGVYRDDSWQSKRDLEITKGNSPLEGSYGGFQPKPAVELILVAMKPLSEKTYVEQALKNKKGITWLDDCRIPIQKGDEPQGGFGTMDIGIGRPQEHQTYRKTTRRKPRADHNVFRESGFKSENNETIDADSRGRFPANLLVSDNILAVQSKGAFAPVKSGQKGWGGEIYGKFNTAGDDGRTFYGDIGLFSRYFDLDRWAVSKGVKDNFPFLICPKSAKSEKNKGCRRLSTVRKCRWNNAGQWKNLETEQYGNIHPTVKPVRLMAYLITLGSRTNDIIFDPFIGSGTTAVAAKEMCRNFIGIEKNKNYAMIAQKRVDSTVKSLF